jgi:hypothetical protein
VDGTACKGNLDALVNALESGDYEALIASSEADRFARRGGWES